MAEKVMHFWQRLKSFRRWKGKRRNVSERVSQGGFTLVELMVVVAIIAILTAVAIPQFTSAGDKAKAAKIQADQQAISNAVQLYMIDKSVDTVPTVDTLYKEGYLSEVVKTPKGGNYSISYEQKNGSVAKKVIVTPEDS